MVDGPDQGEPNPTPFPGDAFWRTIESAVNSIGLGTPRTIFKIRKARAQWEARRAADANIGRGVTYTHKACPGCARLVERRRGTCPYCGANVRWAPGPGLMRWLGLSVPHGSAAMALVGANMLLYAITTIASSTSTGHSLLGALFAPDLHVLYNMGGLDAGSVLQGQIWRLWTYQFLHFGALHIFFNLMALLSLGPTSEDVYGPAKTMALYWTTGVVAGMVSLFMKLYQFWSSGGQRYPAITIGASGAIFGLIGLLIGHSIRRGGAQGAYLRTFLVRWAVYGLIMGFALGADNAAHVGGLASGFLLGLVVPERPPMGRVALLWRIAAFAAIGLTLYGFTAAAFDTYEHYGPQSARVSSESLETLHHRVLPAGPVRLGRSGRAEPVTLVEAAGGARAGQHHPRQTEPSGFVFQTREEGVADALAEDLR